LAEPLAGHARRLAAIPVRELFAADPDRFGRFSREAAGLLLDFSRQRLDVPALAALEGLAAARGLPARVADGGLRSRPDHGTTHGGLVHAGEVAQVRVRHRRVRARRDGVR
jgi:hypothetical protein